MLDTLDERVALRRPARHLANKVFPSHWSFLLGEVALFSFMILVATGVFLTMFYRPSTAPVVYTGTSAIYAGRELPEVFASIVRLSHDVDGGLLFRRIHRASSHVFIGACIAHLLRVVLTGAFRRPRELNYLIGLTLLLLAVGSGYSGHNLPYDVLAGTSLRILYTLLLSVPYLGEPLALGAFGGEFPGDIMPRLFVVHVLALPGLIAGLMTVHLLILGRQTHTQLPRTGIDGAQRVVGEPLWPWQAARSTGLALGLGATVALSAALVPWSDVDLHGPFEIAQTTNTAQPDWFLFWVEGVLRIYPPIEFHVAGTVVSGPLVGGVLLPLALVALGYAYPFLERRRHPEPGDHHVAQHPLQIPFRAGAVAGVVVLLVLLTLAAGNDVIARLLGLSTESVLWAFRIAVPLAPPLAAWGAAAHARAQGRRWT